MLNILSIYAGYVSWYDFKKKHLFADEILKEFDDLEESEINKLEQEVANSTIITSEEEKGREVLKNPENDRLQTVENTDLQKSTTQNQKVTTITKEIEVGNKVEQKSTFSNEFTAAVF